MEGKVPTTGTDGTKESRLRKKERASICFSKMENIVTYDEETIRLLLSFLFNDLEENDVDE